MGNAVLRFAPSPNGPLHEGHGMSAKLNRAMADALGGRLLIRIEDLDTVRCTPALASRALHDLAAIGITSDGPILYQSERTAFYAAAMSLLRDMGLVYPSALSRGELRQCVTQHEAAGAAWPRDPDGAPHYPTDERDAWRANPSHVSGGPHAWRLDLEQALDRIGRKPDWTEVDANGRNSVRIHSAPHQWGDPVLWRRDGAPAYHLAVVVDDAEQDITHIVRGTDLREATSLHRVLQELLSLPEPLYHHHPLLRDAAGRKLSKSAGDGVRRGICARPPTTL